MPRSGSLIYRLDRYLFRQICLALLAVTGGLTALIWLTQSLRFVELVVDHGLSLSFFLEMTGMLVPSFVAVILPITTFVVIAFTYHRLAGDRELTVMRSVGLSPWGLARPAIAVAVLATLVGYLLSLWIVPASMAAFHDLQWELRNRIAAFLLQDGVFTQIAPGLTVYVRSRDPDGTLQGVMIDDARKPDAHSTLFAERGRLIQSGSGPQVVLSDGSRQEIDFKTGRLNVLTFRENVLDLTDDSHRSAREPDSSEVSLHALLDPHLGNPRDVPRWIAEGHKRLTAPLTALSYGLVALVAVLTGPFKRHGSVARPFAGVLVMIGLIAAQLIAGDLAARDNRALFLLWVEAILPGLVCAWLLFAPMLRSEPLPRAEFRAEPAR
ncbi:MAG TPA: LPS export ABC transporter permease LptF [Acetobacteraceae bacterium]|nr:LPS export ABC transporter permease LptF [Acetobacteraceae bacterium]